MSSSTDTDRAPGEPSSPAHMEDMELREEWQDDGFPRPLPEDCGGAEEAASPSAAPPTSLALSGTAEGGAKKRLVAPSLSLTLSRSDSHDGFSGTGLTADELLSLDINLEALETPSDSETEADVDLEWEDDLPRMGAGEAGAVARGGLAQPEAGLMEADHVDASGRRWRSFRVDGHHYQVNMSVLEPYLEVLSHGGYYGNSRNAIIVFSCCYLPENTVEDYDYVMDQLFRYMVGTLDLMVSENYLLVCLCAMAPRNKLPPVRWLHQCYTSISHRLRKDLKGLLVVHPAWYIKALITLIKPFISDKFSKKICFIQSLQELSHFIPTEQLQIPDAVRRFDEDLIR